MKESNVRVDFSIKGDDFKPEHFSKNLFIEHSIFWEKGNKNKNNIIKKFSF